MSGNHLNKSTLAHVEGVVAVVDTRVADLITVIVREAHEWLGTKFVYGGKVKGRGVDCAEFAVRPFKAAGLIHESINIPRQHADWLLAKKIDNPYFFRDYIMTFADKIDFNDRRPGDLISFTYIGIESHVGILIEKDMMIHAVMNSRVRKARLSKMNNICSVYRHRGLINE